MNLSGFCAWWISTCFFCLRNCRYGCLSYLLLVLGLCWFVLDMIGCLANFFGCGFGYDCFDF